MNGTARERQKYLKRFEEIPNQFGEREQKETRGFTSFSLKGTNDTLIDLGQNFISRNIAQDIDLKMKELRCILCPCLNASAFKSILFNGFSSSYVYPTVSSGNILREDHLL